MPAPLSVTVILTTSPTFIPAVASFFFISASSDIRPPEGMASAAFTSRFQNTCLHWSRSNPKTSPLLILLSMVTCPKRGSFPSKEVNSPIKLLNGTETFVGTVGRAYSRKSRISPFNLSVSRRTILSSCLSLTSVRSLWTISWTAPLMEAKGFLISWAMRAESSPTAASRSALFRFDSISFIRVIS